MTIIFKQGRKIIFILWIILGILLLYWSLPLVFGALGWTACPDCPATEGAYYFMIFPLTAVAIIYPLISYYDCKRNFSLVKWLLIYLPLIISLADMWRQNASSLFSSFFIEPPYAGFIERIIGDYIESSIPIVLLLLMFYLKYKSFQAEKSEILTQ